MANIDFSKVERLFNTGISDFEAQNIQYLAVVANSMGEFFADEIEAPLSEEQKRQYREIMAFHIKRELKFVATYNKSLLAKLGKSKKIVEELLEDPHSISEEDWEKIGKVREVLATFREEIRKQLMAESEAAAVEKELKKARSFRFNIRDHWLPIE